MNGSCNGLNGGQQLRQRLGLNLERGPALVLVLIITIVCAISAMASETDSESSAIANADSTEQHGQNEPDGTIYLPALGYTPDTGVLLGATMMRFFSLEEDPQHTRPSVFSPVFVYTLETQIMVMAGTSLNWDQSRNALNLLPRYEKFPGQYYGTGRDVDVDLDEEDFTSETISLDLDFDRRLWRNWRLGLAYQVLKQRLTETEEGGKLASGIVPGTEDTWLSTLGPTIALDNRDNLWAPDHGVWLQSRARFGGSSLGSDFTYQEYTIDLRGYRAVGKDLVLAGQVLGTRIYGEPPYFVLPRLGGADGLRGYRGALYNDRARALARIELRRTALWGRMGGVVFGGLGDVAPTISDFTTAGELWTAGFGVRYPLNQEQRVNLRLDFGFGNGDSGFYLSLGESF